MSFSLRIFRSLSLALIFFGGAQSWSHSFSEACVGLVEKVRTIVKSKPAVVPNSLATAKVIPRNPEAKMGPQELSVAGKIAKPGELAHLDNNGVWVVLIDKKGRIIYEKRTPNLDLPIKRLSPDLPPEVLGKTTVTHRSLENKFLEIDGVEPEIVFAGEIHRKNGHTSIVSNQASTFPAGMDNLGDGLRYLGKEGGLPIERKTWLHDASHEVVLNDHQKDVEASARLILYHQDPLYIQTQSVYAALAEKFPDHRVAGFVDLDAIQDNAALAMKRYQAIKATRPFTDDELNRYVALSSAKQTIEFIQKGGPEMVVHNAKFNGDGALSAVLEVLKLELLK